MNNKILIPIIAGIIIVIGVYLAYSSGPVVSAQGFASIKALPDEVSVNINVETRGKTAQEAQDQNKIISDKLLVELIKIGFDRDELKFVNYNVYPEYDWSNGKQTLKGYIVSQQLIVKTTQVAEVPGIVDAAISAGALVSYINFEISDAKQSDYKNQALEEASKDARKKAESTAQGLGKDLGSLVSVESQDFNYPGPIAYYARGSAVAEDAAAKEAAMSITPQDIEVTASVSVRYKLRLF